MLATIFRTGVLYIIVILCMRIMGKRQVGELQPGELVVTILISELASIPMQDLNRPVTNGLIAILVLVVLEIFLSFISLKCPPMKRLFSGKPSIVIHNGVVDQKMMKKLRITIDDLLEGLRQTGSFQIENVDYCIMETNGKLSVLQKKEATPPTRDDLNVHSPHTGMPVTVISDGKLQQAAFTAGALTKGQVDAVLKQKHLKVEDVFLMTADGQQHFFIIQKER